MPPSPMPGRIATVRSEKTDVLPPRAQMVVAGPQTTPRGLAGVELRRWCLLVLVVLEIRARVTAPAKIWQRRRGFRAWLLKTGGRSSPGSAHADPEDRLIRRAQWLRAQ